MDETATSVLPETAIAEPKQGFAPAAAWQRLHRISPFASNVLITTVANFGLAGLALVTGPLTARLLGPSGRGELAAIQNLYLLLATIGMLGLAEATLFFTAKKERSAGSVLSSALLLALLVSPIFVLVGYFLAPVFLAAQAPDVVHFARLCILGLPLYPLTVIPLYMVRGTNNLLRWNILRILPAAAWFVFLVAACFLKGVTPQFLAIGYPVIIGFISIPILLAVRRTVSGAVAPESGVWKPLLRYGVPLAGATIPVTLNLRLDQMLMAAWLPSKQLGFYVVAVAWSGAVAPLLAAIGAVLFPRIACTKSTEEGAAILGHGTRIAVLFALLIGSGIALLTPFALPTLFGKAFTPSVVPAITLVFAACVSGLNVVLEQGLQGLGESTAVLWSELGGALVTCVSLYFLLRKYGIIGAAASSSITYSTVFVLLLINLSRKTRKPARFFIQPQNQDVRRITEKWRQRFQGTRMSTNLEVES